MRNRPLTGPRDPCAGSGALCCPAPVAGGFASGVSLSRRRDRLTPDQPGLDHSASVFFAAASITANDLRTWLRSVVYQNSGSDAFR